MHLLTECQTTQNDRQRLYGKLDQFLLKWTTTESHQRQQFTALWQLPNPGQGGLPQSLRELNWLTSGGNHESIDLTPPPTAADLWFLGIVPRELAAAMHKEISSNDTDLFGRPKTISRDKGLKQLVDLLACFARDAHLRYRGDMDSWLQEEGLSLKRPEIRQGPPEPEGQRRRQRRLTAGERQVAGRERMEAEVAPPVLQAINRDCEGEAWQRGVERGVRDRPNSIRPT